MGSSRWSRLSDAAKLQAVLSLEVGGQQGLELSAGQKQLLCLARMLLRGSDIVLLDECTASVDHDTARVMSAVLQEQLHSCTVLQIAHEVERVMEYDAVMVMEAGEAVEVGQPEALLRRAGSAFAALCAARSTV